MQKVFPCHEIIMSYINTSYGLPNDDQVCVTTVFSSLHMANLKYSVSFLTKSLK